MTRWIAYDDAALHAAAARGEPVPSPCIAVCRIDPESRLCEGCSRTLDEIAGWGTMSEDSKRAVWGDIARRRAASSD
jgi:predicted Fe-S protein YdhL (DUF1289 family)